MSIASTIGVLGGSSPAAANYFCALVARHTAFEKDSDRIPVVSFTNPGIPDCADAILYNGPSPLPELIRSARLLEQAGVDFIVIPSLTAHNYLESIRQSVRTPVLDMVALCCSHVHAKGLSAVGYMGSNATMFSELFLRAGKQFGTRFIYPTPSDQAVVMYSIFGDYGIKAGHVHRGFLQLRSVAQALKQYGAEALVLGSSDLSVNLDLWHEDFALEIVDPIYVAAIVAITLAKQGFKKGPDDPRLVVYPDVVAVASATAGVRF